MEEIKLRYSVVTPLFGYGAYQKIGEIRTSEIKGIMRYVYRITCPTAISNLFAVEKELFGSPAVSNENDLVEGTDSALSSPAGGHASPIRLSVRWERKTASEKLLLHDKRERNYPKPCISDGVFYLVMRMNQALGTKPIIDGKQDINLNWYADLARLAFIFCGVGQRSRKGRGRADLLDSKFTSREEAARWICKVLNQTAIVARGQDDLETYTYQNTQITPLYSPSDVRHPVIQKIQFGNRLNQYQIRTYLAVVDKLCHDDMLNNRNNVNRALGSANPRFASSLWLGMVRTDEGIFPVYLFVTALKKNKLIDRDLSERNQFVADVENGMKKEVGR